MADKEEEQQEQQQQQQAATASEKQRAGAAPEENSQRPGSAHSRHSLTKGRDSTGSSLAAREKDALERAKLVRERQNEERQRKLEELRQQALAAQRFREQREEERRRRIDELRSRDNDRRSQVEERKRLIWEAERERREAILRKNQEREARIEAKRKNERSHIVFAFGSSTPRMLEPADTGGSSAAAVSFWGTRRATSTTNVMMYSSQHQPHQPQAQLTRRSSERELDGSKKRATSAGGLDRKPGEGDDSDAVGSGLIGTPISTVTRFVANRRRTDLVPTIPSPRDINLRDLPSSGRSSSAGKSFTRSPGIRSGEATPSSPSRPHSSMSQQSAASSVASSSVNLRPRTGTPRRPRPASIAGTGVTTSNERNNTNAESKQKDSKPPLPKVHSTPKKPPTISATSTPASATKTSSMTKSTEKISAKAKASPRVTPRATPLQSPGVEQPPQVLEQKIEEKEAEKKDVGDEKPQEIGTAESAITEAKKEEIPAPVEPVAVSVARPVVEEQQQQQQQQKPAEQAPVPATIEKKEEQPKADKKSPEIEVVKTETGDLEEQCDMTASMIQKIRITTEEEAKAALAERRRLAREQAEREAELERQRLEEEARKEAERQCAEEEEQRRLEEETLRLAQEAREAEEQRLRLAIEEATRREEEDRKRREEEARQKQEKEEAERKAREEAEKQRLEMVERLKKEEEERNARRKRVEAIMSRTRAKNQAANQAAKGEGNDGEKSKEDSPTDENKSPPGLEKTTTTTTTTNQDLMTSSLITEATQQFISSEQRAYDVTAPQPQQLQPTADESVVRNGTHANGINDSKSQLLDNNDVQEQLNGHHNNHGNGLMDESQTSIAALDNATVKQNNVTNNLLDLSEFDTLSNSNSNSNTGGPILLMPTANEDSLNSNLNPSAVPFTPSFVGSGATNPFQDAFANNKQQDNQLPDLLS